MNSFFHKEFYPTPKRVLDLMQINCNNKVVLEPSAGKGDIIDYLYLNRAKEVIAFEINKDLQKIVSSKCVLLGDDFLECKPEQVSHIDMIVMNPPFSNADKHIEHAYEIAPEGCEIIALCNYASLDRSFSNGKLKSLIRDYGDSESLGNCFDTAERKTGVEVGLVKLFKPTINSDSQFEGFFMDEEDEDSGSEGVMQYNEVFSLVSRYVGAIKAFDRLEAMRNEVLQYTSPVGLVDISFNLGYNNEVKTKEAFSKDLQKRSWDYIFRKMNMDKYVTSGVMKDINAFVEKQQKYPFTMKNIYKMFEIIIGTRQQTFNRALEEAIDNFTKHTHENRFGVEGWKTNSGYMLNEKFIIEWMVEPKYSGDKLDLIYRSNESRISDLIKVMCNILGQNYNEKVALRDFFRANNGLERSIWYQWEYFDIKCFKKGTMHLKFRNKEDWYRLNRAYGELKGFTLSDKYK